MQKKYIVRLTEGERQEPEEVVRRLNGTSRKVRRAQILLKADSDGPGWTDQQISEAFGCRVRTVEKIRQRMCEHGFESTLNGAKPEKPPEKLLDGKGETREPPSKTLGQQSSGTRNPENSPSSHALQWVLAGSLVIEPAIFLDDTTVEKRARWPGRLWMPRLCEPCEWSWISHDNST